MLLKSKKKLGIPIHFVSVNIATSIQKSLRDLLRPEFEKKNTQARYLKRELLVILNQENFTLRKVLNVNKNPEFCLINLREGIFVDNPAIKNSPLFHPDLKDILGCLSAGLLDETIIIMAGNRNEQLLSLAKNGIAYTVVFKNADGKEENKSIESFEMLRRFLEENQQIHRVKLGKLTIDFFLNFDTDSGKTLFSPNDIRTVTEFIWSANENKLRRVFDNTHNERNELVKLKKFALVLPKTISGIINDELKNEGIKNVSRYHDVGDFVEKKDDVSLSKIIEYLEKTKYKDLKIYFDHAEQTEILSVIFGSGIFELLESLKTKLGLIIPQISNNNRHRIFNDVPDELIQRFTGGIHAETAQKKNPPTINPSHKNEIMDAFLIMIEHSDDTGSLIARFTHAMNDELVQVTKNMLVAYAILNLQDHIRQTLSDYTSMPIPSQEAFERLDSSARADYLNIVSNTHKTIEQFFAKNPPPSLQPEKLTRYLPNFLMDGTACLKPYLAKTSMKFAEDVVTQFPETAPRDKKNELKIKNINQGRVTAFFDLLLIHYTGFVAYLKKHNHVYAAVSIYYTITSDENLNREYINNFWDTFERFIGSGSVYNRHGALMSFLKTPDGDRIKKKILENISYLSNRFDLFVCMSYEKSRLNVIQNLIHAVCVEIPKEIEQSYLDIFRENTVNLQNKDEVIQYITTLIDGKIQLLQKENRDNPIEVYLMETVLLLLKLIFFLLKKQTNNGVFEKLDMRGASKEKLKRTLKKRYHEISLTTASCGEKANELNDRLASADGKKERLIKSLDTARTDISHALQIKKKQDAELESLFRALSKVVENQRLFAKALANYIHSFVFADAERKTPTGSSTIFNFSPGQIEHINENKICFITFSAKFIGFINFCLRSDNLPEETFYIGNQTNLPDSARYIFVGPDVDKTLAEKIVKRFPDSKLKVLALNRYEEVLDKDERQKRTLKTAHQDKKNALKSINSEFLTLKEKETEFETMLGKFDHFYYKMAEKRSELDEIIVEKKNEQRRLERNIRVLFEELDKIDKKFNATLVQVKKAAAIMNDVDSLSAESLSRVNELIIDLIKIYGEFEFLIVIKRISDMAASISTTIRHEILRHICKRDRISYPPSSIVKYVIFHDSDKNSITCAKQVQDVLSILTSHTKTTIDVHRVKPGGMIPKISGTPGTVYIIVFNDNNNNLRFILSLMKVIPKYDNEWNILSLVNYKPLGSFGDKMNNELAMNVFSVMERSILINLYSFDENLQMKILNIIYTCFNYDCGV